MLHVSLAALLQHIWAHTYLDQKYKDGYFHTMQVFAYSQKALGPFKLQIDWTTLAKTSYCYCYENTSDTIIG